MVETKRFSDDPSDFLKRAFLSRKDSESSYSSHTFAREIGMSQAFVSLLLNRKRRVSLKLAVRLSHVLKMDDDTAEAFFRAVALSSSRDPGSHALVKRVMGKPGLGDVKVGEIVPLLMDQFKIVSRWYHIAILDLCTCEGFKPDPAWIAVRLGISQTQAEEAVERLLRAGLLIARGGRWIKKDLHLTLPTEESKKAVRIYHRQMIGKALAELSSPAKKDFDLREISGVCIAVDPSKMPEAKKLITEFRQKLATLMSDGHCTEVFHLNVQLFKLTQAAGGEDK